MANVVEEAQQRQTRLFFKGNVVQRMSCQPETTHSAQVNIKWWRGTPKVGSFPHLQQKQSANAI